MIAYAKHIRMSVEFIVYQLRLKQEVPENKYGRFILMQGRCVSTGKEIENVPDAAAIATRKLQ